MGGRESYSTQWRRADGRIGSRPDHVTTPINRGVPPPTGLSLRHSPIAAPTAAELLHIEGGGRVELRPRVDPPVVEGVTVGRGGGGVVATHAVAAATGDEAGVADVVIAFVAVEAVLSVVDLRLLGFAVICEFL